ncbi:MAG: hypothetical protein SPH43_04725 [Candidatus Enteromonas sp.]|nr:hypothetical protein [Candidatus Enteromonas sp.]
MLEKPHSLEKLKDNEKVARLRTTFWVTFFYENSLQQRTPTDDSTVFAPIQTGGETGIRTLAGA